MEIPKISFQQMKYLSKYNVFLRITNVFVLQGYWKQIYLPNFSKLEKESFSQKHCFCSYKIEYETHSFLPPILRGERGFPNLLILGIYEPFEFASFKTFSNYGRLGRHLKSILVQVSRFSPIKLDTMKYILNHCK